MSQLIREVRISLACLNLCRRASCIGLYVVVLLGRVWFPCISSSKVSWFSNFVSDRSWVGFVVAFVLIWMDPGNRELCVWFSELSISDFPVALTFCLVSCLVCVADGGKFICFCGWFRDCCRLLFEFAA